ncbi:MAG TPA: outer membrane beta-barrel protein, partial [Burkholderiaceae bacterium]|nr:outer membrane beta-barrel protein [Burkholderiaceae bacterium]
MSLPPRLTRNVLALAATLACAGGAAAQNLSQYNPSPYVELNGSVIQPGDAFQPHKTGGGAGLKFGIPISPDWDIQIGGNWAKSNGDGTSYSQTMGGADALWYFSPGPFRPYLVGGVGADQIKYRNPALPDEFKKTSPYVDAGVGFQWRFTPQWAMQADVRAMETFFSNSDDNLLGLKRTHDYYANVGLVYAFGTPPAPPSRPMAPPPPPPPPPPP